jgi:Mg-chelatase subunit ChlD
MVQGIAPGLIEQLGEKEQMAIVAFHSTPDLIQDFTSSKELLQKAIARLKFGNDPDVIGAIYASADTGFENALERHVILLVSPGLDAGGRVSIEATIKLARKNGVSVYLISPRGFSGWYEDIAKRTGGAAFNLRELAKAVKEEKQIAPRILEAVRGNYTLTLAGNLALGEKLKIQVPGKRKLDISALPLD